MSTKEQIIEDIAKSLFIKNLDTQIDKQQGTIEELAILCWKSGETFYAAKDKARNPITPTPKPTPAPVPTVAPTQAPTPAPTVKPPVFGPGTILTPAPTTGPKPQEFQGSTTWAEDLKNKT